MPKASSLRQIAAPILNKRTVQSINPKESMNVISGLTFVPHANAINVAAMTDIIRAALNLDSDMVEVADGTPIQRVQSTIDFA